MGDANKLADLCYTASFAFDRLADIAIQVHDLERESIKTPMTVENVEQNVMKFNRDLEDPPRMRPSSRTYLPRRNAFNRPLDTYRPANSYTHYQTPTSYRLVPNSNMKSFNLRNDQSTSNPSNAYRKRPNSDNFEAETEAKQVKGIKWVAASGQDVKNSGLNIANLATSSNSVGNLARREYSIAQKPNSLPHHHTYQSTNQTLADQYNNNGNRRMIVKPEPLSPVRKNRPLNSFNLPQAIQEPKVYRNEDEQAVDSLLQLFNENNESESSGVEY